MGPDAPNFANRQYQGLNEPESAQDWIAQPAAGGGWGMGRPGYGYAFCQHVQAVFESDQELNEVR